MKIAALGHTLLGSALCHALSTGVQILHLPRRSSPVMPHPGGEKIAIEFPASAKDLNDLDAWLTEHTRCQVILIRHGNIGYRDFKKLMAIKDRHGVVVSLPPSIRKKDLQ